MSDGDDVHAAQPRPAAVTAAVTIRRAGITIFVTARRTRRSGSRRPGRCGCSAGSRSPGSILRRRLAMCVRSVCVVLGVLRAPDLLQQRAVRQQPAAVAQQRAQQVELDRRQVDLLAVRGAPVRAGEVDLEPVGARSTGSSACGAGAAQRPPAGARQLARAERLGHVVVGAGLERADLVRPPRRPRRARGSASSLHSRSARQTSTPSPSGSTRSRIAASGRPQRARRRAPPRRSPPAAPRSRPRAARPCSARTMCGSSSQTRTRGPPSRRRDRRRTGSSGQRDHEARALPRQRLRPHLAAVGLDEALRRSPARARSRCARGADPARDRTARRSASARSARIPGPRSTTRTISRSPTTRARTETRSPPE